MIRRPPRPAPRGCCDCWCVLPGGSKDRGYLHPCPGVQISAIMRSPAAPTPDRAGASRRRIPALRTRCSRPMCPDDAGSVRDIDELRPRPRMSLPAHGNRFRRLRSRPALLLPAAVPARRRPPAPRPQGTAARGYGVFVINSYPAMCVPPGGCSWSWSRM